MTRAVGAVSAEDAIPPGFELAGRFVLVTGGARRVGAAISSHLADRGARVVVQTRSPDEEARRFVAGLATPCHLGVSDLSDADGAERILEEATSAGFPVTAVIHAASSFVHSGPLELDGAGWNRVMDTNLRSFYLLARSLAARAERGDLIAISDSGALELWPGYLAHCVSKAALVTLTLALAKAMAPRFRVNAVLPGPVLPPPEADDAERERMARRTLLGRLGEPADVARAVRFLLESPFATGTTLEVTGGAHLWRSAP